MSDTISHATQGGLILLGPFIYRIRRRIWLWVLGAIGAFFGALPDLLGAYGYLIRHDHMGLYQSAHTGAIASVLQYVPMYWLHLRVDSVTHGPMHRWWIMGERLWLELLFWTINIAMIWWYSKIWRRTHQASRQIGEEAGQEQHQHIP